MNNAARDARLDALIAKDEIRQLIVTYARGLDRCDVEIMKSVFHEDAVFEHATHFKGSALEFCEHAVALLRTLGEQQHFICNQTIELNGDKARSETYGFALHRCVDPANGQRFDNLMGARLLDRYERRNGVWKIVHRQTVVDWNNDIELSETWAKGAMGDAEMPAEYRGRKDANDPSYTWLSNH